MLGDAAGWLQNRRGWPRWVSGRWKGAVASPSVAARDQAGGVVTRGPGARQECNDMARLARALIHALGAALMGVIVVVRVRYSCRAM